MSKLLTLAGLAAAATLLNAHLQGSDTAWIEPPASIEQELDPRLVEVASLGHLPAWVDAVVIRSLGDPAYDPVPPGTHPPLYYELKLATALDPRFLELYAYGASILSIVRRDGPGAAEILERAHALVLKGDFQKGAWQLEMFRGYNAFFELQDAELAADAFETAARLPGAPPFIHGLARRLQSLDGRYLVARRAFESLLQRQNDPQVRQALEARSLELELSERLYRIDLEFKKWLGGRPPGPQLFDRFRGAGYRELRWNTATQKIDTLEPREPPKGLY